jgi:hypothetical protein
MSTQLIQKKMVTDHGLPEPFRAISVLRPCQKFKEIATRLVIFLECALHGIPAERNVCLLVK